MQINLKTLQEGPLEVATGCAQIESAASKLEHMRQESAALLREVNSLITYL